MGRTLAIGGEMAGADGTVVIADREIVFVFPAVSVSSVNECVYIRRFDPKHLVEILNGEIILLHVAISKSAPVIEFEQIVFLELLRIDETAAGINSELVGPFKAQLPIVGRRWTK